MKKIGVLFICALMLFGCGSNDEKTVDVFDNENYEISVEKTDDNSMVYIQDSENKVTISALLNGNDVVFIGFYDLTVGGDDYYTVDEDDKLTEEQKLHKESYNEWLKTVGVNGQELKEYIIDYYKENK
ncbi:hypothetical protein [Breznakia pachnodae]|uniref:DUF4825 domain-containing protein n=1 Tax=Breznakia pachnodae TaxID=265178 RepID=A0ABU0E309_9FIRM|nr:hypothetical protein [Breznakia pachnodae]MDQ0361273.1 hypothetical protein [Breznakia pachnodae]